MKISSFESYLLKIPKEVNDICISYEGWIVGGAARFVLDLERTVKDWDILIPWNRGGEKRV